MSVDPIGDQYKQLTPYQYASNDPINQVDIDGLEGSDAKPSGDSGGSSAPSRGEMGASNSKTKEIENKSSFKDDWNEAVGEFNQDFKQSIEKAIDDPIGTADKMADGILRTIVDVLHMSDLVGQENKTRNAVGHIASEIVDLPNKPRKEQIKAGLEVGKMVIEGAIMKRVIPVKASSSLSKADNAVLTKSDDIAANINKADDLVSNPDGSFSISDWKGYPEGPKPNGTLKLIEGAEYDAARKLANKTNASMRKANPEAYKGKQIHEIKPVKFGGSPTDKVNKIPLSPKEHAKYTTYWNRLMRDINRKP